MSTRRWIVVADAAEARILLQLDPASDTLALVQRMAHPDSRAKGHELASDRPGHEATDHSPGGNRFEPRTEPRRKAHREFAHEIAHVLQAACAKGEFDELCIAASPAFLGELKLQLSDAVRARLAGTIDSDLTALEGRPLLQRLRAGSTPA